MNQLKRIAAVTAAVALTFGLSSGRMALADTSAPETNAVLNAAAGANCALTLMPAAPIDFGTFTYIPSVGAYEQSGSSFSEVTFALTLGTLEPNVECDLTVVGDDLVKTDNVNAAIPVEHIGIAQGTASGQLATDIAALNPIPTNLPITAVAAVPDVTPATLVDGSTDPVEAGSGIAVLQATLGVSGTDNDLPSGSYVGVITFTASGQAPE